MSTSLQYFSNVNPDLLDWLPLDAKRVLEIGCGTGSLGRAYLTRNPISEYCGVELFDTAADSARKILKWVVNGNIEQAEVLQALDTKLAGHTADVLVFGDVLEHLHDPWQLLTHLRQRVSPGGVCVACIPNIAHWSILVQQLQGHWDYADAGLLDRTHIRFFTLNSAMRMLQQSGWTVLEAKPRILQVENTRKALQQFESVSASLGIKTEVMRQNLSAFQWVIRAVNTNTPAAKIHVAGFGLRKQAGVTEARIDHPLKTLSSLPNTRVTFAEKSFSIPPDWEPGILILQRQFLIHPDFVRSLENLIAKGWIILQDMDDDPHHWREFVDSDFYAYRAVHAVIVSTEPLADMIRAWNPEIRVFPNAIYQLPDISPSVPKQAETLRLFFGALNRGPDWRDLMSAYIRAAESLGDAIEFVIVHDRAFFEALPDGIRKEFHNTLPQPEYLSVLATCDLALLPLNDTRFNRMKSDLKFIECCAAGVVPICSSIVYGERPEHREIGYFADTPEQWLNTLILACGDRDALRQRRERGLHYVQSQRMHAQQLQERADYYRHLLSNRASLEQARQERLALIPAHYNPLSTGNT